MGRFVLEATARDGHARILNWQPSEGQAATTPNLIVPVTGDSPVPAWAEVLLADQADPERITLVSDGTWFHPRGQTGELVVHAPQPTATHQVQVLGVGEEIAVFHDAGGWASNPQRLVPAFIEAKAQAGCGKAFWAPAVGTPADYAVWAYAGVDLFDASPLLLAAVRGEALTVDGPLPLAEAEALYGDGAWDVDDLMAFNLEQARQELARVRAAIQKGQLRALAERRCYTSPATVALLRRFDRQHGHLEAMTPARREEDVPCMTQESLWAPSVERFRRRFQDDYTPPAGADTLVLLPCSARKPYRLSTSHRYFQRALDDSGMRHRCHEVMVTSPLGLVPRDLEDTYPANRYDVPVTGHWNRDEEAIIRYQLAALLERGDYKHVVAHVSASTYTFLRDLLPDGTHHTGHTHHVQSKADCDRLRDTLREIKKADAQKGDIAMHQQRKLMDLQGMLSHQVGPGAAEALVDGAKAHGKVPFVKLVKDGTQLGMTTIDRGMVSFTIEGADIVAAHETKRVFIEDFWPRKTGSLFAVGVTHADGDVREGDDVSVCFQGPDGVEVRACGTAQMNGVEMADMKRGVAVTLRHVRKEGGA